MVIADITGYSRYLTDSELVHAEQSLSSLIEVLVDNTRPPMRMSKLEGDAVLSFGFDGEVAKGQAFVESIEVCYIEFRRALDLMVLNTTCECNACANISALDLKFVVHHGEYVISEAAGIRELVGSDVNLIHRVLKNSVTEDTGIRAYILYTAEAIDALELGDLAADLTRHEGFYEDVGRVEMWISDLATVWKNAQESSVFEFVEADVVIAVSGSTTLPLDVVWAYLIDPEYRSILIASDRQELTNTRSGRVVVGSVYQCYHGDRVVPSLIIEWMPMQRIVTNDTVKMLGVNLVFPVVYELKREGTRTTITQIALRPEGPMIIRSIVSAGFRMMRKQFQRDIDQFLERIQENYAERRLAVSA